MRSFAKTLMFLAMLTVGVAEAYTIRVGTYVCNAAAEVAVPVTLDSAAGLSFVSVRLAYDPQILTLEATEAGTLASALGDDFTVTSNETGCVTVGLFGTSNVVAAAGSVAVLRFTARENTERLYSDITITDVQLGETEGVRDVTVDNPVQIENGMVRIMSEGAEVTRLEGAQTVTAGTRLATLTLNAGDAIAAEDESCGVSVAGAVSAVDAITVAAPRLGWKSGDYRLLSTATAGLSLTLTGLAEEDAYTVYETTENDLVVYRASVHVAASPLVTIGEAVNAPSLAWETSEENPWRAEVAATACDGIHAARSANIGDSTNTWIEATVSGSGTLSFAWKTSCESKTDMLQLLVDGVVKGMIYGETGWCTNSVDIVGAGDHRVRWAYRKGRSGSAGEDAAWIDGVSWVSTDLGDLTLAMALNENLYWMTEGDVTWQPRLGGDAAHPIWADVQGLADNGSSCVWTYVYGAGTLTFDWAGNIEAFYDWMSFSVDGVCKEAMTGEQEWTTVSVKLDGGKHLLEWLFWKDEEDEEPSDSYRARLDNVVWSPADPEGAVQTAATNGVPSVSFSWLKGRQRYLDQVRGDYEAAALLVGRNGRPLWQSYVAGLDPEDEQSDFRSYIEMVDGVPKITWKPNLGAERTYTTLGKKTLLETKWSPVTESNKSEFNFFKVQVELK